MALDKEGALPGGGLGSYSSTNAAIYRATPCWSLSHTLSLTLMKRCQESFSSLFFREKKAETQKF